jgi:hypothetical protein
MTVSRLLPPLPRFSPAMRGAYYICSTKVKEKRLVKIYDSGVEVV